MAESLVNGGPAPPLSAGVMVRHRDARSASARMTSAAFSPIM